MQIMYIFAEKIIDMDFYRAYFIQDGTEVAKDTLDDFEVYLKDIPFDYIEELKEVPSNSWYDEMGDDEYLPPGGVMSKGYEIDVEWAYKGAKDSANAVLARFINYLRMGSDQTKSPFFTLYDNFTKITRHKVRLVKLHNDAELVRQDEQDILIFKTTLKVNGNASMDDIQ